jgi:hypothetical protein
MCNCASRYKGEEGKEIIIELAKIQKEISGENQAIAKNNKEEYYFFTVDSDLYKGVEILQII